MSEQSYTVRARYTIAESAAEYEQPVQIIPGYTTEEDIPKIIAVSRTGRPDDAMFIRVMEVKR